MAVTLISYATKDYSMSQRMLLNSARLNGADHTIGYNRRDLERTDFYREHRNILDEKRGGGYWLWKPYFIRESLRKLPQDDILVYADAAMLFRKDMHPLLQHIQREHDMAFFYNDIRMSQYTKRDAFVATECDTQEYYVAPMVHANLQIYRNTPESLRFIDEVLHFCTLGRMITDDANVYGKPNLPDFIEHRHDQSIFSLLAHKHRKRIFADPSQFLTKNVEYVFGTGDIPISTTSHSKIVYMHRYKNSQLWKLVPDTISKILRR